MNREEQKKLEAEVFSKFGDQIEHRKGPEDEVKVVIDDEDIHQLSKKEGCVSLGIVSNYWVRLVKTAKRVTYILLLSSMTFEGMQFVIPRREHVQQIFQEYADTSTWQDRVAERQSYHGSRTLSFSIEKDQPHVPEVDHTTLPTVTTLNVPITGLSPDLFKHYSA